MRPVIAALMMTAAYSALAAPRSFDTQALRDHFATDGYTLGRPTAIWVAPAGDEVLFLRSGPRDRTRRLYAATVASGETRELVTPEQLLKGAEEKLSSAEKAQRERMRLTAKGFASYTPSRDGQMLVLPLSGKLFGYQRASGKITVIYDGDEPALTPQLSPDGASVAYVKGFDLYVRELASGKERRLTSGGSETLTHGLAEFVAQEEMGRFTGFWWSPDSRRLAYEQADHRGMERFSIADPAQPGQAPESFYYPRPGKANAKVRLGLIAAAGGPTRWVQWDAERYPYLFSVSWQHQTQPLSLIVQTRDQREQAILAVDAKGDSKSLLVQSDRAWLDPDYSLVEWLPDGSGFITASEASGVAELELHAPDGALREVLIPGHYGFLRLARVSDDGAIYALCKSTPTTTQLLRVRAGETPVVLRDALGEAGFSVARGGSVFAERRSTPQKAEQVILFTAEAKPIGGLPSVAETPTAPNIELTSIEVEGRSYQVALLRPRDFDPARKYPVLDAVYGGPTANVVSGELRRYLKEQWFADQGAVVVLLDNRGTQLRGRDWARAFKDADGRNGDGLAIIVHDHAEVLKALAARYPELDAERIGIYGWSYGGTSSAAAVMLRPDVFKVAVAGAPVSDWLDYDTHYTERYLDLPAANPQGYAQSSLLSHASKLTRPLLLIHGTGDDNVYFSHSLKLADALFKAGKPFEFLPLVNFTHMVSDPEVQARLYERMAGFLFRHLDAP